MTIKTEAELLTSLADNQVRAITPEALRDAIDSGYAVGGTLYGNSNDPDDSGDRINMNMASGWQPFEWFTDSIDTKGVSEDLTQGHFTVGAGADGLYKVDVAIGVTSGIAGWIEIAITKNGALTPYRMRRSLTAGGTGSFSLAGSGSVAEGDTIGLAIRPSGTPPTDTVAMSSGQFRVFR